RRLSSRIARANLAGTNFLKGVGSPVAADESAPRERYEPTTLNVIVDTRLVTCRANRVAPNEHRVTMRET
ncbi:MAG: hypothetical protein ACRD3S_03860, partial [Terracidiphilus sp.]